MPALMTTRGGERVRARKRGSTIRLLRTIDEAPAGSLGRIVDVRLHGRGVQYLVQVLGTAEQPMPRVWVGGRFVANPPRRRPLG